jgi:hypothetical protein
MVAFTASNVAASAGLRLAEIRGLRWADYVGRTLAIRRAVWRTYSGRMTDYIFADERGGAPLNLANLVRRVILPTLAENEDGPLQWKGWRPFRRSLATNLHLCGVDRRITQAILPFRHAYNARVLHANTG